MYKSNNKKKIIKQKKIKIEKKENYNFIIIISFLLILPAIS